MENKSPQKIGDKKTKSPEEVSRDKRIRRNCFCCGSVLVVILIIGGISLYRLAKGGDSDANIPIFSNLVNKDTNKNNTSSKTNSKTPSSGSTSTSTESPSSNTTTTDNSKLIQFFIETALRDTSGQHQLGVVRWTKNPTTVGVAEGNLDSVTSSELSNFISDFNGQSGTIKLQRIDGPGDIRIYYLPPAEIQTLSGNLTEGGFEEGNTADDCSMTESRVFVSSDPGSVEELRKYTIRHEMTHAVGFGGHSDLYTESIMAVARQGYSFPEVDKKAIQMLYNSNLPLCSRDAKVKELYQ